MDRTYPTTIAGLTARPTPGFDREQWTTCSIASRTVGDVVAFRGETPLRQVVLTATRTETVDGENQGRVIGEATYLDTGDTAEFKLRTNDSVLTRCDLRYKGGKPMSDRPYDPDCTCGLEMPGYRRIWCDHCLTHGPLPGSLADPDADHEDA